MKRESFGLTLALLCVSLLTGCGNQAATGTELQPPAAPAPAVWCGGVKAQTVPRRAFSAPARLMTAAPGVAGDHPLSLTGLPLPPENPLYPLVKPGWDKSRWEQATMRVLPGCEAPVIAVIEGGFQDLDELGVNLAPVDSWLDLHALRQGQAGGDPAMTDRDRAAVTSHGRATAGVIADVAGSGVGLPGYGYNLLRVLPISIPLKSAFLARAIEYAALGRTTVGEQVFVNPTPAQVINLSLATDVVDAAVQLALARAAEAGVVVVASSGNAGREGVFYPASDPNVLAVGAYDDAGMTTPYTSTGPELFALGYGRTYTRVPASTQGPESFVAEDGTSFGSPFVAAQLGLWLYSNSHYAGAMFAGYSGSDHLNFALKCLSSAGEATASASRGVGVIDASRLVSAGNLACR